MAFQVEVLAKTQPGATGNQTYSLSIVTDPKAVLCFAVSRATEDAFGAATDRHAVGIGCGTYRGSVVQQWTANSSWTNSDAASINNSHGAFSDALLKLQDVGGSTVDLEIDLVSMAGGGSPQIVVNWANLHTTASIRVYFVVFGGSDITDAVALSPNGTASASENLTVTGFGQPDFGIIGSGWEAAGTASTSLANLSIGFFNKAVEQAVLSIEESEQTNVNFGRYQRLDRVLAQMNSAQSIDYEAHVDTTVANWPTDGVQLDFDTGTTTDMIGALFLKGTFQTKIGVNTVLTAGSPPVDQDISLSFTPVGALFANSGVAASTTVDTTSGTLGSFALGAADGTNEAHVLLMDDDGNGNQRVRMRNTSARAFEVASQSGTTSTLEHSADAVFQTNNLRLTYQTRTGTVAVQYIYVAFGSAAGGGSTTNQALTATATSTATIVRSVGKNVTATATSTATIAKSVGKNVTATATSTASIVKQVGKTLTGNATVTATLEAIKVVLVTLTATVTSTATLARSVGKNLTATATSTATIAKEVGKSMSATATVTATMTAIKVILLALSATVTTTATIARSVGKNVTATATTTASITKQITARLTATVTSSATLSAVYQAASTGVARLRTLMGFGE